MPSSFSRRAFFRQAAAAPVAAAADSSPAHPRKAWIILAVNWQHNDEWSYPEGEYVLFKVYFDRQGAEAECQRQCAEFLAAQTPQEFEVDMLGYSDNFPDGVTEDDVTWEQLLAAGFPPPFSVQELES